MVMNLNTNKIKKFFIVNAILVVVLYLIPIEGNKILENLCLIKNIFGVECPGCGMTRAFLSILHFDFDAAIAYNWKCIFVFPIVVILYLYFWYQYMKKEEVNNVKN